jgi:hypothetical protein
MGRDHIWFDASVDDNGRVQAGGNPDLRRGDQVLVISVPSAPLGSRAPKDLREL